MKREEIALEETPKQFQYLHKFVPGLAYWKVRSDFRDPKNFVGHIQRAHSVYWSVVMYKKTGGMGLDIGCGNVTSPYCIGLDNYADRGTSTHPVYGGRGYKPNIQAAGEKLPFKDGTFDWIISNHSLEHLESTMTTMLEWLRVLKTRGIMAIVMPDRKYGPFGDPSHKHEYTPEEFCNEILNPLIDKKVIRVLEYDTFDNHFSFDCVLEKR